MKEFLSEFEERLSQAEFEKYRPYGHPDTLIGGKLWKKMGWEKWSEKPWQLDFHNAGLENDERLVLCANGVGKSLCITWEVAAHVLGEYPDWYKGYRFNRAVKVWVASIDADQQREGIQTHLLGKNLEQLLGTGFIPRRRIIGKVKTRQAGISEVADRLTVKSNFGGYSIISFKTYSQGWRSFQAAAPDIVLLDEEPDENDSKQRGILDECETRLVRIDGLLLGAVSPLLGETDFTRHFRYPKSNGIYCGSAVWDDVAHLSDDRKEKLKKRYPSHKLQTRVFGVPMMGEGRIFDVDEDDYKCAPFKLPNHFARIAGIDFGIGVGHPTAGAWLAWDRDRDIVYLTDEYRKEGTDSIHHAEVFKRKGKWIPISWPHDGHKTSDLTKEKSKGSTIADKYRGHGMNMLGTSARYKKEVGGAQDQWPIIETLIERMKTGRFYVFSNLHYFFEEARSFHTKDGKIVNRREDLIKAVKSAKELGLPLFILGGGSNILFSDDGFDGLIVKNEMDFLL